MPGWLQWMLIALGSWIAISTVLGLALARFLGALDVTPPRRARRRGSPGDTQRIVVGAVRRAARRPRRPSRARIRAQRS